MAIETSLGVARASRSAGAAIASRPGEPRPGCAAASRACQRRTLGPVVASVPSVEVQPQA